MKPEPENTTVFVWLFGMTLIAVCVGLLNLMMVLIILHGLHL